MSVTLNQVCAFLDEVEVKYHVNEEQDSVEVSLNTSVYKDADGKNSLFVVIQPIFKRTALRIVAPAIYNLPEGPNAPPTARALLHATGAAQYAVYSCDLDDGSVRASVTIPVGVGQVVLDQLRLSVVDLRDAVDYFDPVIRGAIERGEIVLPDPEKDEVEAVVAEIEALPPEHRLRLREALKASSVSESAADERAVPETL